MSILVPFSYSLSIFIQEVLHKSTKKKREKSDIWRIFVVKVAEFARVRIIGLRDNLCGAHPTGKDLVTDTRPKKIEGNFHQKLHTLFVNKCCT